MVSTSSLPYSSIKILDFTRNVAGPFATMILADLGAEVIKIEDPDTGDDTRRMPPFWNGESVTFLSLNRNKKSVVLDLKSEHGRQTALKIGATADIVVESFRPGVAERLGLGADDFVKVNSGVIFCSVSGFGRGPLGKNMPGYDPILQAFAGMMSATGEPGTLPSRSASSIVDLSTGMWTAIRIMSALAQRREFRHQKLEVTLVDSAFNLMCFQIMNVLANGVAPVQLGSASAFAAPYEAFKTSDGFVMVAAGNDRLFRKLCDQLDLAGLASDPSFSTIEARVENRASLHRALEGVLGLQTTDTWVGKLSAAGIPVGPVQDLKTAMDSPIFRERDLLMPVDDQQRLLGLKALRLPLMQQRQSNQMAPALGQHGDEVLTSVGLPVARPR